MTVSPQFAAKTMAKMLGLSLARVGQLAKEGVITKKKNGQYSANAVTQYVAWLREKSEKKSNSYSALLEKEKHRAAKRQNDLAESHVAPVAVLEEVLERGVAAMIPILEGLPLAMKRLWPEISGDQITLVKKAVAETRNALAEVEIDVEK